MPDGWKCELLCLYNYRGSTIRSTLSVYIIIFLAMQQHYLWSPNNSEPKYGKSFNISGSLLDAIGFPLNNFITLPADDQGEKTSIINIFYVNK